MTELLTQFMPMFSVLWIAWWARRRVEQCEARCTKELERIIALLPAGDAPTDTSAVIADPIPVTPVEMPLPVARALKA